MTEYNQFNKIAYHEFPSGEFVICSSNKDGDILFYFCSENRIVTVNTSTINVDGTISTEYNGDAKLPYDSVNVYDKKNRILTLDGKNECYYLDEFYRPIKYFSFRGQEEVREYDNNNNLTYIETLEYRWIRRSFNDDNEVVMYEDSSGNFWDKELMTTITKNPY
jgi:hypothetical protein